VTDMFGFPAYGRTFARSRTSGSCPIVSGVAVIAENVGGTMCVVRSGRAGGNGFLFRALQVAITIIDSLSAVHPQDCGSFGELNPTLFTYCLSQVSSYFLPVNEV
jgi:hypothetical protein